MADSAPTRRSSRGRNANTATPAGIEETSPAAAEAAVLLGAVLDDAALLGVAAQPLSRRAARERQCAAADIASVVEIAETAVEPEPSAIPAVETPIEPVAADADADAFIAASRAFRSLSADEPVNDRIDETSSADARPETTAAHVAPRRRRSSGKLVAFGATVGVMGIAGMLAISMTLPAEAVAAVKGTQMTSATSLIAGAGAPASEVTEDEIQAFVAPSDVENERIERSEDFSTASLVDIAAERGINFSDELYTNDPDAAIQWPFVVGVGMSYGFGMRSGRMHEGIDLVPGAGAPVQSIADGTVRIATESGGNYGVTVYIDHVIDGQVVTSHYSHMQYESLRVVAGQEVKVGDIIGNVGNTGRSYGAHMHFELIIDDVKIDPLPWMQENAGRYDH